MEARKKEGQEKIRIAQAKMKETDRPSVKQYGSDK